MFELLVMIWAKYNILLYFNFIYLIHKIINKWIILNVKKNVGKEKKGLKPTIEKWKK